MCENVQTTRHFRWGLERVNLKQPHARRATAFCEIDKQTFVTSDGSHTYFWNHTGLDAKLDCAALSLAYIQKNRHIVASVRGSSHLHFIPLQKPYQVSRHPAMFSTKTITSIFFFARQGILVTAGQGIMFTEMMVPRPPQTAAQFIQFSKIAEVLADEIFTFVNPPVFVEELGVVLAAVRRCLYVYSLTGRLVTALDQVSKGDISSVAFDLKRMEIVVGDTEGNVFVVEYGASFPTMQSDLVVGSHLLSCCPYERYFMMTVSVKGIISLHCLINGYEMSQFQLEHKPIVVRCIDDFVFVFSSMGIEAFKVCVFMEHFKGVEADVQQLNRLPRAHILGFMSNASIFMCKQQRKGEMKAEIRSRSMSNEVARVVVHGETLGLVFEKEGVVLIDINNRKKRFGVVAADDEGSIRVRSASMLIEMTDTELFGLAQTGHLYKFSIAERHVVSVEFIRELTEATVLVQNGDKLLVAAHEGIFNIDPSTFRITAHAECESVSFVKVVDGVGVICGTAFGAVEIRDQQSLEAVCSSRFYNAVHSPKSLLSSLNNERPEAVKSIDYLPASGLILSISNSGEIFVWTKDLYPVAHFEMSFLVTSACFLDNGGIILSALSHLFVIPPTNILEAPLAEEEWSSSASDPPPAPVESTPKSARKKKSPRSVPVTDETTSDEQEEFFEPEPTGPVWEDLIVEQEVIPKHHFCSKKLGDLWQGSGTNRTRSDAAEVERIKNELKLGMEEESEESEPHPRRKKRTTKPKKKKQTEVRKKSPKDAASPKQSQVRTSQKLKPKAKPKRAKSARATQLLYPEERMDQQKEAKFGRLNRPNEDRKQEEAGEFSRVRAPRESLRRSQKFAEGEQQHSVHLPQRTAPRRNPRRLNTAQPSGPRASVDERKTPRFSFNDRKTNKVDRVLENEGQNKTEGELECNKQQQDEREFEISKEQAQQTEEMNQIEVTQDEIDDGTRIDMNAAMVDFIEPVYDYGSIGNVDMEQMKRELELRSAKNVIIKERRPKKKKKKKGDRIRVFKVKRASSARRP